MPNRPIKTPLPRTSAQVWPIGRDRQAQRGHQRAEDRNRPHSDPVGDPSHDNAAEPRAQPDERSGERHHRPVGAEGLGDRLQSDDDDERRAIGYRQEWPR